LIAIAAAVGVLALSWHYTMRKMSAKFIAAKLPHVFGDHELNLRNAFLKNTRMWHSAFTSGISGWGKGTRRMISEVIGAIEGHIQRLNDEHTDPSGRKGTVAGISVVNSTENVEIELNSEETQIDTGLVADETQKVLPSEPVRQPNQVSAE